MAASFPCEPCSSKLAGYLAARGTTRTTVEGASSCRSTQLATKAVAWASSSSHQHPSEVLNRDLAVLEGRFLARIETTKKQPDTATERPSPAFQDARARHGICRPTDHSEAFLKSVPEIQPCGPDEVEVRDRLGSDPAPVQPFRQNLGSGPKMNGVTRGTALVPSSADLAVVG